MKTEEVFAAYHAARRAEEVFLNAAQAADRAGFKVDWTCGSLIVAIERAALTVMKDIRGVGPDAARRDAIFAAVAKEGDHTDIVGPPTCDDISVETGRLIFLGRE